MGALTFGTGRNSLIFVYFDSKITSKLDHTVLTVGWASVRTVDVIAVNRVLY